MTTESKSDRSSNCWCVANWRTFIPHPNCPIHAGGDRCRICHDEECDGIHEDYEAEREAAPLSSETADFLYRCNICGFIGSEHHIHRRTLDDPLTAYTDDAPIRLSDALKLTLTGWVRASGPIPDEMVRRLLDVIGAWLDIREGEDNADVPPVARAGLRLIREEGRVEAEDVLRELQEGSRAMDDPHFRHWANVTIASYFSAQEALPHG